MFKKNKVQISERPLRYLKNLGFGENEIQVKKIITIKDL
jgi:hypothetical protein